MKKLLASILILTLVLGSYREAKAVLPLLPAAATAAATALGLAGGVYYYMQQGGGSLVSPSNVARNAAAAYYVIDSANRVSNMIVKPLNANLSIGNIMGLAGSNPTAYPNLSYAASGNGPIGPLSPGSIINYKAGGSMLTGVVGSTRTLVGNCSATTVNCGSVFTNTAYYYYAVEPGTSWAYDIYRYPITPSTSPATIANPPASPSSFVGDVSNSDGSPKSQALQDELDKAMQDPTYTPSFSDATTGLPWAPPADAVSPAVANEYDKRQEAAAAAAAAVNAANSAVAAAQAAHDAAVAAAAANPNDPNLQDKAAQTLIQLTNAQAAAAGSAANAAALGATQAAVEADAEDLPAPVEPPPGLKSFNWGAATKLLGTLETAWPFNLLMSLRGLFAPLEAPPTAPAFDMHIYGDNKVHIDLSFFDPIATICRWVVSLLLTSLGIMAIVRWYRG